MQLRVRGPQGQAMLQVEPGTKISALRTRLEELTGVPAALQEASNGCWLMGAARRRSR